MVKICLAKKCQSVVSIHSPHWTFNASSQIPTIIISVTDIKML